MMEIFDLKQFTYLALNALSLAYPLLRSFESKMQFHKNFRNMLPAIGITAVVFIVWDVWFTQQGIWDFNPAYITGITIVNLPLEEVLFFFCIPYACLFIYEVVRYFFPKLNFTHIYFFSLVLAALLLCLAIWNYHRLYTVITFSLTAVFLALQTIIGARRYFSHFFAAYFISLIPFLLVNGLLTKLPVVRYNNLENLAVKIYTIPIEDAVYLLLLFLMNVTIYEKLKARKNAM